MIQTIYEENGVKSRLFLIQLRYEKSAYLIPTDETSPYRSLTFFERRKGQPQSDARMKWRVLKYQSRNGGLLQVKPLPHQPLQPGFVDDVVSELFVGEHGECGAPGSRHQL
jgi:hypothetical protein